MTQCVCEVCGRIFTPPIGHGQTKTCSQECRKIKKRISNAKWRVKHGDEYNERRREKRIPKRKENTMADINEMARERGLTYGQMQGILYAQDHPLIHRRGKYDD